MLILKSIVIGMFSILPGVSGSALAISFDIYDRFLISIKNYKENKIFFIELFLGILLGLFVGSKITIYIINFYLVYYILIGIILSEIPMLIKKINGKLLYVPTLLSFIFSTTTNIFTFSFFLNLNTNFKMFIGGILFSFGKIIPGISSSCFLLSLGIYKDILIIFTNPTILLSKNYLPFIIGSLIGVLFFIKLLNYMINNKYNLFYSIIIGFVFSSIFLIIPNRFSIIGIILMIISFTVSIKIKMRN